MARWASDRLPKQTVSMNRHCRVDGCSDAALCLRTRPRALDVTPNDGGDERHSEDALWLGLAALAVEILPLRDS